jgi:hypothetical protein
MTEYNEATVRDVIIETVCGQYGSETYEALDMLDFEFSPQEVEYIKKQGFYISPKGSV